MRAVLSFSIKNLDGTESFCTFARAKKIVDMAKQ